MISIKSTYPIRRSFIIVFGLWCLTCTGTQSASGVEPASTPSERMHLSIKSLLLDIAEVNEEMVVVGERGHILKSKDNGISWRQISTPTRSTLTNVFFADDKHGWASGHSGVILSTKDSGESWTLVSDPDPDVSYFDSLFFDKSNGILVGSYGEFARTADGAVTLETDGIDEEELHFYSLEQSPKGTLYLVGEGGQILRSKNRGGDWEKLDSPYSGSLFGMLCLDEENLLTFGLRGNIFRSADGGYSWKEIDQPIPVMLTAGVVLSSSHILITGIADQVFMSSDKGHTFYPVKLADINGSVAVAETVFKQAVLICGRHGVLRIETSVLENSLQKAILGQ